MAESSKGPKLETRSASAAWETLTWNDLDDWAGPRSVSRGESYQRQGRVKQLRVSDAGVLLAWVHGGRRYATRVELDSTKRKRSDRISSECSCPVRFDCKHAVAVIIDCLEAIEESTDVPVATEADPRWAVIEGTGRFLDDDADEGDGLDDHLEDYGVACETRSSRRTVFGQSRAPKSRGPRNPIRNPDIQSHLESKSHEDLVRLVMDMSGSDPAVRRALADECALADGRFDELLHEARSEMRSLTAEEAWWNPWKREGHLPDYSGLERRLRVLLDHGCADAVVRLGEELMQRGVEQVDHSHDEGETCHEIGTCMRVVYEALMESDRKDEDKIVYAIEVLLADEYGICDDFGSVLDRRWKKATWSAVADRLRERLDHQPKPSAQVDAWSTNYGRERLSGWVIDALDGAGRSGEATQLSVAEARDWGSYTRAVRRLLEEKELVRAVELAKEGLEATSPAYAGIVSELQDLLCEIAAKRGDWFLPASVAADRFFRRPSISTYRELLKAAKKAECERAVQDGALAFLETGQRPDTGGTSKSGCKPASLWPLPQPPQPQEKGAPAHRRQLRDGPYFDVLIDLAIDDKRPADALEWFDRQTAENTSASRPRVVHTSRGDARVARAVETSHPARAIGIYRLLAHSIASETNTKTYPEAVDCLKRIKSLLKKAGCEGDWSAIIGEFRSEHGRKRRLMQAIDGIEGRPIVGRSRKVRRRKAETVTYSGSTQRRKR